MATPIGCSLWFSAVPVSANSISTLHWAGLTNSAVFTTSGEPCVKVPVLSNTTAFTCKQNVFRLSFSKQKSNWSQRPIFKEVYIARSQWELNVEISVLPKARENTCNNLSVLTLCAVSSGSPPLISIPFWAPIPVPTITAVGVARPRAQGHAMASTVMPIWKAKANTNSVLLSWSGCGKTRTVIRHFFQKDSPSHSIDPRFFKQL